MKFEDIKNIPNMDGVFMSKLRGQFSPEQLGARLFMEREDLPTEENILVWFHERFHYLQIVFTPYGQLKWGAYRSVVSDVVESWIGLSKLNAIQKKIPIAEYLKDGTKAGLQVATNTWMNTAPYEIYSLVEHGLNTNIVQLFPALRNEDGCPLIRVQGEDYSLRGIDILESFAKFEEAMLGELITGKTLDEYINPQKLNPEYFIALYYFIEEVGADRLVEFPVICELALSVSNIPAPYSLECFRENAPNWRFVELIKAIKDGSTLPPVDIYSNSSFYAYANEVLNRCNYPLLEQIWQSCIEYVNAANLTMAEEMKAAIDYKQTHPWALSYPMRDYEEFTSDDFSRFEPLFTIVEDGVLYNFDHIDQNELLLELHLQALVKQISGQLSRYCIYTDVLMCGYSYFGNATCPHYLSGECDGYICAESNLLDFKLDGSGNLIHGCSFELILNIIGTSVRDIYVGDIGKSVDLNQLSAAAKNLSN